MSVLYRTKPVIFPQSMTYLLMRDFSKKKMAKIDIPIASLDKKFSRSSGPGGQNVNKLSTKVELRFKVSEAYWLTEDVKRRIINHGKYLNKEGEMVVTSDKFRTQEQNKGDAYQKLAAKVNEFAIPPKIRKKFFFKEDKEAKRKRINYKRRRSAIKKARGSQGDPRRGD